jgi:Kef-type K+ transport system membrane component KefB
MRSRGIALAIACWIAAVAARPDAHAQTLEDAGAPGPIDAADAGVEPDAADAGVEPDAADAGVEPDAADAGVEPDAAGAGSAEAVPAAPPAPEELAAAEQERAVDAPVVEAVPEGPPASAESTLFAIKLIFGLAILLALAYVGGHPRMLWLQEQIGIRGVILAGFPFVALGVVASLPSVAILTDDVIPKLRPLLQFGLGWIGFLIGAQLDIRVLDRVPRGSAYLLLVEALAPFAVTAAACGAVMIAVFGLSLRDLAAWRDIVLLGAAAAMTAPRRFRGFANRTWHEGRGADVLLGQLDEIVGVIGLLFIMAYFRNDATSAWQLPGTAWLFVAVGLGVVIGVLIFALIRTPRSNAEFLAIVLGAIAFASGLAAVLQLSSVVTCFIAGALVTNFPNEQRKDVFRILRHLERPIHLLFLMIAGALWSVSDWRGWALVPLFVACRVSGKWLGVAMTRTTMGSTLPAAFTERRKLVLPMSTLAIALVVSIERFRDVGLSWVVTAVIGGAVVTELLVPAHEPGDDDEGPGSYSGRATPIDELDELDDDDDDAPKARPSAPRVGGPP